jgi:hypothetical protein
MEGIENWDSAYLNKDFQRSDEFGYVRHVAEANVRRMLDRAATAFGVSIPRTQYVNVRLDTSKQSYPMMAIPEYTQTISAIVPSFPGALRDNVAQQNMCIYRECVPPQTLRHNQQVFIMEGPADVIHVIDTGVSSFRHGLPASTARVAPLPANVAAISCSAESPEYKARLSRVFFEGSNVHPDILSSAFQKVDAKGDRSFIESLVKLGWDERANHDRERLVPLLVKVSNPYLVRPKNNATKANVGVVVVTKNDFDE